MTVEGEGLRMLSVRVGALLAVLAAAATGCVPHVLRADHARGIATRLRSADPQTRDGALEQARAELRFRCGCMGGSRLGP